MATIDEKMAKMRLKNLQILKRHQEIEEDRQRAEQSGAIQRNVMESTMNRTRKNRLRAGPMINQERHQESKEPTNRRSTAQRRKLDHTGQLIDIEQADPDEPLYGKKRIIVHNQVDQIGSGRFSQLQRKRGDGKLNERMHRCPLQNTDSVMINHEFHLDLPPMHTVWHNPSMTTPVQLQLVPNTGETFDHSAYLHQNYFYSPTNPPNTLNNNGTIYFVPPPYQPARTFDNSNRTHSFQSFPIPTQTNISRPTMKPDESAINSHTNRFQPSSSNVQHRYQRHHQQTPTLPLSAYMNVDDSDTSYQRPRKPNQTKPYHQEKTQFPLSSYDPRQYGFNQQPRNFNYRRQQNTNRRPNDSRINDDRWRDFPTTPIDSSNVSDDKSHDQLLKSIDHLQQQLKLEEALDECLKNADADSIKSSGTYNTAHFLQWAKKTFREELAGRLTAQEIQQHDAVTEDLESNENETQLVDQLPAVFEQKLSIDTNQSST